MYNKANFKKEDNNNLRNAALIGAAGLGLAGVGLGAKRLLKNRKVVSSKTQRTNPRLSNDELQFPLSQRRKLNTQRRGVKERQNEINEMFDKRISEGNANLNARLQEESFLRRDLLEKGMLQKDNSGNLIVTGKGRFLGSEKPAVKRFRELNETKNATRETATKLNNASANVKTVADRREPLAIADQSINTTMGRELSNAGYTRKSFNPGQYQRFKVKQRYGRVNTTNDFSASEFLAEFAKLKQQRN